MQRFKQDDWALILGGSSGFGLATAKKLAQDGMSVCVVHRDRRGAMTRINESFDEIKALGHRFLSINVDALSPTGREAVISALKSEVGDNGRVRVLLHSIAFGNLKPIAPVEETSHAKDAIAKLAGALSIDEETLEQAVKNVHNGEGDVLFPLVEPSYSEARIEDEDMSRTIYSMGTSLLTWTQTVMDEGLFADDARVIGLTSEGNQVAWRGYAAVSAAKVALESVSRSIALEFAPYGIRSNIVQAGVTDTPALNAIPGSGRMKAVAKLKNPFKRLTTPEDVANVISLLAMDEASWINGAILRVDGGEQIASF